MLNYAITSNRRLQRRSALAFVGESQKVVFDIRAIEEDIGTITSATWTIKTGNAHITNKTLTTNTLVSATVTTQSEGKSSIELKLTAGNNIFVTYLDIFSKDPEGTTNDYGFVA